MDLNLFDIVICVGPNDNDIIRKQIKFTRKNIIGYRNIYLVASDPTLNIDNCITINEKIYPFQIQDIVKMGGSGWYLQQLLKLYAGIIIPDILEKYLVIDSDTCFLQPIEFVQNEKCIFDVGIEYNQPYFTHMKKLHPSLSRYFKHLSGISHHMLFNTKYVKKLFDLVESYHSSKNTRTPFYEIFLKNVENFQVSGASEYEIYFNFLMIYYPEQVKVRVLKWKNVNTEEFNCLIQNNENNIAFISWHWYKR